MDKIKKGDFVKLTKRYSDYGDSYAKGTIGVVFDTDYDPDDDWDGYGIALMNKNGDESQGNVKPKGFEVIKTPPYLVNWTTDEGDPVMYFESLKDAKAFVTEMKKKKRVVEVGLYKRA